ncbi:MAG: hypothetical protein QMD11_06885 [Smithella sp.]|nr:hypothetical protein [Smithella sp.]
MKHTKLTLSVNERPFLSEGFPSFDIISPSVHKGELAQTHHYFESSFPRITSIKINLHEALKHCEPAFADAKKVCRIDSADFPYGQSEAQWWAYCVAPHSYLPLGSGQIQVGLNYFNRFLHLDFHSRSAELVDPEIGNEMLSTTNCFDQESGELWFASWSVEETVRRMLNPRKEVRVTLWKQSMRNNDIRKVWQGSFSDSLHQLIISPDRRFLILTELGLRPDGAVPAESSDQNPPAWRNFGEKGVIPSVVLIVDLETGKEWRLPMLTAAHVEFDPCDNDICYLSSHNIALMGARVGIFGRGAIKKIKLKKNGPEVMKEFSHPDFYRITTHIVFRHRGKTLIGVSGYPDKVFLIDAATMELYKTMRLDEGEMVDTATAPHICRQDSYGIASSRDGEAILAVGTGFVAVASVEEGKFSLKACIGSFAPNSCFTGHLGAI